MYDKFRTILPDDISTVNKWYEAHNLHSLDPEMFPETGILMQDIDTGEGIMAGFVWKTNSKMYQVGFIIKNPEYKGSQRNKQTSEIFVRQLLLYAKEEGAKYIATWTDNKNLVQTFKDIGFTEASSRTSELIAKIV